MNDSNCDTIASADDGTSTHCVVVAPQSAPVEWWPPNPMVAVGLITIWAVHKLTKSREREKQVYEINNLVESLIDDSFEAAFKAWSEPNSDIRRPLEAKAINTVSRLGKALNRLSIATDDYRWRFRWEGTPRLSRKIDLTREHAAYRKALTTDIEDASIAFDADRKRDLELARGQMADQLNAQFARWMDPFDHPL